MRVAVPVLVALLAVTLFWWTRPQDDGPRHDVEEHVRTCRENLQTIYDGLRAYADENGGAPTGSGPAFLGALIVSGTWPDDAAHRARLTCTGPNARPVDPGTDWTDASTWTADSSAYAARDAERAPLAKFPSGGAELEALVACDNADGMNHPGVVNVLYSDRTVKTFELEKLVAAGTLATGASNLAIGPDAPLEELRVLTDG